MTQRDRDGAHADGARECHLALETLAELCAYRCLAVVFCLLALVLFAPGQEQTSTAIALRILVLNSAEESARVRAELEKGADFAVLAREKSVDATSLDGGLLGKSRSLHTAQFLIVPIVIVPKLNTDRLNPDVPKRLCSSPAPHLRHARLDIPIAAV